MNNFVWIGILLILIGEPISSIGQIYQKKYHNFHKENRDGYKLPWHKSKKFWKYYGIEYVGMLMTSISLFFTPIILFIPLSNSKLIFNIIFSHKILSEDIYTSDIFSLIIIFIGSCISIYFSSYEKEIYDPERVSNNFLSGRFITINIVYVLLFLFFYLSYRIFDIGVREKLILFKGNIISKNVNLFIKIRFLSLCIINGILSSLNFLMNNLLIISTTYSINCKMNFVCVKDTLIYSFVSIILFIIYLVVFQQLIKGYNSILLFPTTHICNIIFSASYSIIFYEQLIKENSFYFILGIVVSIIGVLIKISNHLNIKNMKKVDSATELAEN